MEAMMVDKSVGWMAVSSMVESTAVTMVDDMDA